MEAYSPATVFSSIDRQGRYAFGNQPAILGWNLARLAESLVPLFDADINAGVDFAQETINGFQEKFATQRRSDLATSLDTSTEVASAYLAAMQLSRPDITLAHRALADAALAVLGATVPEDAEAMTLELLKNRNDSISAAAAAAADRKKKRQARRYKGPTGPWEQRRD